MGHISSGIGRLDPIPTFKLLNQIVTILGGTKMSFWPFLTGVGTSLFPYGLGNDGIIATPSDLGGAVAIEAEFDPIRLVGSGLHALYLDSSADNHLIVADNAAYTHGSDTAFSIGMWVYMTEALGTTRVLMSKYATLQREYWFGFDTSGKLWMELYDETNDADETALSTGTALTPWKWQFITMTYDGGETAPVVNLYIDATSVHDGTTVETGAYASQVDGTGTLLIGRRTIAGTTWNFEGYVALPFITGKELTAAEVTTLYGLGQTLLGL